MDNKGKLHEWSNKRKNVDRYISMFDTVLASTLSKCQDDPMHALSLSLNHLVQASGIASHVHTNKGKVEVTPYNQAKRWNIGLETARRRLLKTNQRGLRPATNPSFSQQCSTNDRMLRYRRLYLDLVTDILETGIASHRGNRYAQVYARRKTWFKAQWKRKAMHMRHCHSCLH